MRGGSWRSGAFHCTAGRATIRGTRTCARTTSVFASPAGLANPGNCLPNQRRPHEPPKLLDGNRGHRTGRYVGDGSQGRIRSRRRIPRPHPRGPAHARRCWWTSTALRQPAHHGRPLQQGRLRLSAARQDAQVPGDRPAAGGRRRPGRLRRHRAGGRGDGRRRHPRRPAHLADRRAGKIARMVALARRATCMLSRRPCPRRSRLLGEAAAGGQGRRRRARSTSTSATAAPASCPASPPWSWPGSIGRAQAPAAARRAGLRRPRLARRRLRARARSLARGDGPSRRDARAARQGRLRGRHPLRRQHRHLQHRQRHPRRHRAAGRLLRLHGRRLSPHRRPRRAAPSTTISSPA